MSLSPEVRSALRTVGNASIGVGLGVSVLVVAFVVSQFAAGPGNVPRSASPAATSSAIALAATATPPTPVPLLTSPPPSPTPTDPPPTVTPTPTPTPVPELMTIAPYSNSGRRYAALRAPVDFVYVTPIAGTVRVQLYQLIQGEVRVGSNVTSLPFFPYVTVQSASRRIIYRPGALNADTQLLIKDGDRVEVGNPLFKTVGEGASSWRTFYDRSVTANVIASVAALPSGAELDPVAFFSAP